VLTLPRLLDDLDRQVPSYADTKVLTRLRALPMPA